MFYEALSFLGGDTVAWLTLVVLVASMARFPIFGSPFAICLAATAVVSSGLLGPRLTDSTLAAAGMLWLAVSPSLSLCVEGWRGDVSVRLAAAGVMAGTAVLWGALPDVAAGWIVLLQVCTVLSAGSTAWATMALGATHSSWFMAVSAVGVFFGPPDTELTATLGFFLLVAVLGVAGGRRSAPPAATLHAAAFTVVLLWASLHASVGRPAAFPAAIGCLGVLVLGPLVDPTMRAGKLLPAGAAAIRMALHVINMVVCGRIAAPQRDAVVAAMVTSTSLLALVVALRITTRCEASVKGGAVTLNQMRRRFPGTVSSRSSRFR